MIKTKTPRHWGGGIRQVSPPMLTSRLSNIGRWRTNEWKDYSRSRRNCERLWICENVRTSASYRHQQIHDYHGFCAQSYSCKYGNKWRWIGNQTLQGHFQSGTICYVIRHCVEQQFGYIQRKQFNVYGNSPRLTLKGVA